MKILAVDIGTKTGWCYWSDNTFSCGTWTLATPKEVKAWGLTRLTRRQDPRVARLQKHILDYCGDIDVLIHEDVAFSSYTLAVQLYAALRSAVWLSCGTKVIRECVGVTVLKKFATGAGNAPKEQMMGAVARWMPLRFKFDGKNLFDLDTRTKLDDNAADAIHLARWGVQNLARAKI